MLSNEEIVSAVRRSDQAMCEQLATWETLEYGVAFCCPELPSFAGANQLRDVWLADIDGETAFSRAEAYYAERALTCHRWTPASGQTADPVDALLTGKGWRRVDTLALGIKDWDAAVVTDDDSVRVLPARAMRRAYGKTFEGDSADLAAGLERLNDGNHDAFVCTLDGEPAGRATYVEVGDIARLADVFVLPAYRRRGVGRALVGRFLQLARRLSPKSVVASCESSDAAGRAFLERHGFAKFGMVSAFERVDD